jgi:FAD/FMN-containing dehydrogenase
VNDEMVIDLSNISYVRKPEEGIGARGAGANFGRVNPEMDLYGLHVPGGGRPTVSVGGFMQGGGYGFTSLLFGMNCDSVMGGADGVGGRSNRDGQRRRARRPF